ncbi:alpha/beta hydrolase [Stenotrophomonas sp. CFBP8980]|uniref:alpha/beta fold hydrolase n=1 Tax=Stenotrophomonas sp. CFBP8980 TaxID=3096523 RepID=UPI002A6A6828|nr:alpha/beta hydrolase [Stenotrophomonas sp. CFBP8980]MDY1033424.1 alpha/beta hydrolase [Stenotrophomonas sp. CFBP8980]
MTNGSAPLLIILPGLDGSGRLSVPFMEALGAHGIRSEVIAYPKERAMGYDALRDWLRPQLLERPPFVLLGESFAGPLAVMLGATGLSSLRGIILSTTFAHAPVPAPSALARVLQLPLPLPPVALLARLLFGRWRTPSLESVLRARAMATLRIDVRALLPKVSTPVLCLHANEDRLLQASALRSIERAQRQPAESQLLDGPHLLLQAQPVEAATRVASWLRTLDRGTLPHAPPKA